MASQAVAEVSRLYRLRQWSSIPSAVIAASTAEGECRRWSGAMTGRYPSVYTDGQTSTVRSVLLAAQRGTAVGTPRGYTTCGAPWCVSPSHVTPERPPSSTLKVAELVAEAEALRAEVRALRDEIALLRRTTKPLHVPPVEHPSDVPPAVTPGSPSSEPTPRQHGKPTP